MRILLSAFAVGVMALSWPAHAEGPRHTAQDAIAAATAEMKRRGNKEADYWVELVRYEYKKSEWWVHFFPRKLILDTDITVILNDKTWKACYIFGLEQMECA